MSTWNPALPTYTSKLALSPGYIQNNWNAIDSGSNLTGTGFTRNHVTMSDFTNGGLHSRVDFYQAVASPAIAGFISSTYPKTVSNVELFYKNTAQDIAITNSLLNATAGEGMLPGGLLIKAGRSSGVVSVTFTTPFPNATLSVTMSPNSAAPTTCTAVIVGNTGFNAIIGGGAPFSWIAVGY